MENISKLYRLTIEYNILPIVLKPVLVSRRKDQQYLSSVIQFHNPLFVVYKDGQADPIEEKPLILDEAFVYEVQVIQRDDAG